MLKDLQGNSQKMEVMTLKDTVQRLRDQLANKDTDLETLQPMREKASQVEFAFSALRTHVHAHTETRHP